MLNPLIASLFVPLVISATYQPVRPFILGLGGLLALGFATLGVLVAVMGEGLVPTRLGGVLVHGAAAYPMAVAWIGLAVAVFCISLLIAQVGSRYYVRSVRNWAFLTFALGFIVAVAIAFHRGYSPGSL